MNTEITLKFGLEKYLPSNFQGGKKDSLVTFLKKK